MLEQFVTSLLPLMSLIIQPRDNGTSTCLKQDFSERCINRENSFHMNGRCYQLPTIHSSYALGGRYFRARQYCSSKGMRMASVQNVDLAEMFITFYKIVTERGSKQDVKLWINNTNNNVLYSSLDGLKTTDGLQIMQYEKGRTCFGVGTENYPDPNLFIKLSECDAARSYYCESVLSRQQCLVGSEFFYMDDHCYQLQMSNGSFVRATYTQAQQYCSSIGARLPTVRSVDSAQMFMTHFRNVTGHKGQLVQWIDASNDSTHGYNSFHGLRSTDGVATMAIVMCTFLENVNGSHLHIGNTYDCDEVHFFYCESVELSPRPILNANLAAFILNVRNMFVRSIFKRFV